MKLKHCIFLLAISLFVAVISAYSQDEDAFFDKSVFENPQRTVSVFDHDNHNDAAGLEDDCSICHHLFENKQLIEGESSEDSPCSECHPLKKSEENSIPLRMAYHKKCKTCHFNSSKGPVLCGECHKKK